MNGQQKNEIRRHIKVMQAALDGKRIQFKYADGEGAWTEATDGTFNWHHNDYRVAPDQPTEPDPGEGWELCSADDGEEFFGPITGEWRGVMRRKGHRNRSLHYRRRITTPTEPQWHDDAPPTVEQVGGKEKCWITTRGGTVAAWNGGLVRRYFSTCNDEDPIAWMELRNCPEPYSPYRPPTTWQKTADRPPTEADADQLKCIAARRTDTDTLSRLIWKAVSEHPQHYDEWIPTAALLSACRGDQ